MCVQLNILIEANTEKYLGLPPLVGLDRVDCFTDLIDKLCNRLAGYKENILSYGSKEILLKAVAQAIPACAMSVFKLMKQVIKGIIDAMSRYWWGDEDNQKHMHRFAWWKMCVSKKNGGMGFRDLHCFNLALLGKQSWRSLCEPKSLCARMLRAKYYPSGDLLNAELKKGSSCTWQSILYVIQTFKRGHVWRVGDGSGINIWTDSWIPSSPLRMVVSPRGKVVLTKVLELINPITRTWDEELLRNLFFSVDANRI